MKRYLINVLASQDLNEIADYFTTIFYRILDDDIEILRVVSGRRDLLSLFEEQ
jgi:hypothetical protein